LSMPSRTVNANTGSSSPFVSNGTNRARRFALT
jgi:hypothetical protein